MVPDTKPINNSKINQGNLLYAATKAFVSKSIALPEADSFSISSFAS
jgi:hypothetical protein